jgi:protein phosphatase
VDPEYSVRQAVPGDRYLICSDGLTAVVSAETIAQNMREYVDPAQCVDRLIQLALRGGGPDNITVIVADVTDEDIVEQRPLVGGAAARDRGMVQNMEGSTPASRASALQAPRSPAPEQTPEEEPERPKRHPVRTTVLLVVLLGLLGGGLWYGWRVSQQQYYVGATPDGMVAIYQGIPGEIAGLHLSKVHQTTSTRLDQLTKVAQDRVKQGISADNENDAQRKLDDLLDPANGNTLPTCHPSVESSASAGLSTTGSPSVPPAGSGSPTASPSVPGASASGSVSPSASPTPGC